MFKLKVTDMSNIPDNHQKAVEFKTLSLPKSKLLWSFNAVVLLKFDDPANNNSCCVKATTYLSLMYNSLRSTGTKLVCLMPVLISGHL